MIFAIANRKGGVTKTTTAVTLAYGTAEKGKKTLLVDLDPQANCADQLGVKSGPDLYHWLIDGQPLETVAQEVRPNLFLIRSDNMTVHAINILVGMDFKEYALSNALDGYDFDVVFLDCPPSASVIQTAALVAADYLIVPTTMEQLSIKGIYEIKQSLSSIQRVTQSNCQLIGIIPAKYDRRSDENPQQLEALVESFGGKVWAPVPTDAKVPVANRKGKTLWEYAPNTRALKGYKDGKKLIGGYQLILDRVLKLVK